MSQRLERLLRLRRRELDRERLALAEAGAAVQAGERQLQDLQTRRRGELAGPRPDPLMLGRYLKRVQLLEAAALDHLARARGAHEAQAQRLLELRVELRRLEILCERQAGRDAHALARREQGSLDDLARSRHVRRPG